MRCVMRDAVFPGPSFAHAQKYISWLLFYWLPSKKSWDGGPKNTLMRQLETLGKLRIVYSLGFDLYVTRREKVVESLVFSERRQLIGLPNFCDLALVLTSMHWVTFCAITWWRLTIGLGAIFWWRPSLGGRAIFCDVTLYYARPPIHRGSADRWWGKTVCQETWNCQT